jgi:hypothetical protein
MLVGEAFSILRDNRNVASLRSRQRTVNSIEITGTHYSLQRPEILRTYPIASCSCSPTALQATESQVPSVLIADPLASKTGLVRGL